MSVIFVVTVYILKFAYKYLLHMFQNYNIKFKFVYFQTNPSSATTKGQTNNSEKKEGKKEKFIRCVRNLLVIEQDVGEKEVKFRDIGEQLKKLRAKRDYIDEENKNLISKICELEIKSPDLSMTEFKEMCTFKFNLKDNQKVRTKTCEKIAKLIKESQCINSAIVQNYQNFKTFAYMKKKLL